MATIRDGLLVGWGGWIPSVGWGGWVRLGISRIFTSNPLKSDPRYQTHQPHPPYQTDQTDQT